MIDMSYMTTYLRRYQQWVRLVDAAPWNAYEEEKFNTPKGHAVEHLLAAIILFGAADVGRLNNAEGDHVAFVKQAAKHTRRHHRTMMNELEVVADRITVRRQILDAEWFLNETVPI
jgi:hypothetical protein